MELLFKGAKKVPKSGHGPSRAGGNGGLVVANACTRQKGLEPPLEICIEVFEGCVANPTIRYSCWLWRALNLNPEFSAP
jgi:hypothetical protein